MCAVFVVCVVCVVFVVSQVSEASTDDSAMSNECLCSEPGIDANESGNERMKKRTILELS